MSVLFKKSCVGLSVIVFVLLFGLFTHELGHGFTAMVFGAEITYIEIMPGIQLYPEIKRIEWDGNVGSIGHLSLDSEWKSGLATLMGSGSTAIVAYLAIVALYALRPKGTLRFALFLVSLIFAIDIVAYSILPKFGLQHWIIIGGTSPEPLIGALMLGVSETAFYTATILHFIVSYGLTANYIVNCTLTIRWLL